MFLYSPYPQANLLPEFQESERHAALKTCYESNGYFIILKKSTKNVKTLTAFQALPVSERVNYFDFENKEMTVMCSK